ncbi:tyrosine-type recombinase/integrase [Leptospira sp. GIMC2001]|uniref:tyrosine-type recombinase/integrase n=1 Tax=Leptospira sp. GIMC2001 TaxID=1513297 RepID=UPI00234B491B|nr:tyrosine-type recombinase/integrase [Leptospira sp. GIMC2001]WCL49579.1 tyrosine-type recombinase/integrase [Leptospira sp. GIMC2001]
MTNKLNTVMATNNIIDWREIDNSILPHDLIIKSFNALSNNYIHSLIFKILISTGIYINELINIKIMDLDSNSKCLNIEMQGLLRKRSYLLSREIYLEIFRHSKSINTDGYIFMGRNGQICDRTVQKILSKLQNISPEKPITISRIRDGITMHLLCMGYSSEEIGCYLGHSSIRSTRRRIQQILSKIKDRKEFFRGIFRKYA